MRRRPGGALIGEGRCRRIYEHRSNPQLVVKVAKVGYRKVNKEEARVWRKVVGGYLEPWYAPVVEYDPLGRWLVMRRTEPATSEEDYPVLIPAGMRDVKRHNWGWLDGRMACHDYHTCWPESWDMTVAEWTGVFSDPWNMKWRVHNGEDAVG